MDTLTDRRAACAATEEPLRSDVHAQVLRACGANGFGDAAIEPVALEPAGLWQRLRSRGAALLARQRADRQHRQHLRLIARLDNGTLRDLGIDRSELPSLAAEVNGTAAATRRWTDRRHADFGNARLRINSVDCFL